jgi:hypothetical protein
MSDLAWRTLSDHLDNAPEEGAGKEGLFRMGSVWRARSDDGHYEGNVAIKFVHAACIGRPANNAFESRPSTVAAGAGIESAALAGDLDARLRACRHLRADQS